MVTVALGLLGMMFVHAVLVRIRDTAPGRSPVRHSSVSRAEAVRRVLRHIARRPIAELAEGDAAVVRGTAVAVSDHLRAPLSGRSCIGYHVLIRSYFGDIVADHARCGPFAVADATGEVGVSADGLELAVTDASCQVLHPPLPAFVQPWVPVSWRNQSILVSEGLLLDGAQVAACGVMQTSIGAGELYREGHARRELIASPTFPLVASPDRDLEAPSPRPVLPEQLRGEREA